MTNGMGQEPFFVGSSAASRRLADEIEIAARSDAKVLITGETGVGKDVVARLLHQRSARGGAALAAINCAGLPDGLLESELFGHVRGSFTGAVRDKAGLLEIADNGTAFLDEAGEMSLRMQGMLLRFLETGEVQRVGCERTNRRVNVRIIAATNRDLADRIAAGLFRMDLYYRLNVIRIHVAPLRERTDDIAELFQFFADQFARQYGVAVRTLTADARCLLLRYSWPGNIRELKNLAERLAVRGAGEAIRPDHLAIEYLQGVPIPSETGSTSLVPVTAGRHAPEHESLLRRLLADGESFWTAIHRPFMERDLSRNQLRTLIRAGLERTSGNYRLLVELFNMAPADYKRFLAFLRKHDCQVPFQPFRSVRSAGMPNDDVEEPAEAAAV